MLCYYGVYGNYYVHRMVAQTWIPNPYNYPEVNPIDGNRENNSSYNLEWCSSATNHAHAIRTGLIRNIPKRGQQGFQKHAKDTPLNDALMGG